MLGLIRRIKQDWDSQEHTPLTWMIFKLLKRRRRRDMYGTIFTGPVPDATLGVYVRVHDQQGYHWIRVPPEFADEDPHTAVAWSFGFEGDRWRGAAPGVGLRMPMRPIMLLTTTAAPTWQEMEEVRRASIVDREEITRQYRPDIET